MMNKEEVKQLLEKFYAATTNEKEEMALRAYFSAGDVAEELEVEKAMFIAFLNASKHLPETLPIVPEGLEHRLERQIDRWNIIEKTVERKQRRIGLRWVVGIAASLLLLLGVGMMVQKEEPTTAWSETDARDTYKDPQAAYAEASRALMKFSEKLNGGIKKMENMTNEKDNS